MSGLKTSLVEVASRSNDSGGSNGGSASGANPSFTSRVSFTKFCSVVSKFNSMKRVLALETGFGGLMELKLIYKINLKLSATMMDRVDADASCLVFDEDRRLSITDEDFFHIFGLPSGGVAVDRTLTDMSETSLDFVKDASAISDKGAHSLKAAEQILTRDINEKSVQRDIDSFKKLLMLCFALDLL